MAKLEFRRRELLLALALICVLFLLAQNHISAAPPSVPPDPIHPERSLNDHAAQENDKQKVVEVQQAYYPSHRFTWDHAVPETTLVSHVIGWTIVDNIYIMNGTLFIVSSEPESWPKRKHMTSSGYGKFNGPEEVAKRMPTNRDMQIITPQKAQELFGRKYATRLDGVSFYVSDPKQFLNHYFHWSAECLLGLWRTYSSLDTSITADGLTKLPLPKRMMFSHIQGKDWRDYAHMNEWVTRGAFPSISLEFQDEWTDRAETGNLFVLDRAVLADRSAASESEGFKASRRTIASAFDLPSSPHWWKPLRRAVLEFSGVPEQWIVGPDPAAAIENRNIVITYVSRQEWGRRMLRPADHDKLVEELYKLRDRYGYEVNVVSMHRLSRAEQLMLASRTTVMMGVHGNGLTSLIWMRPTIRSTVIEFFYPSGFAFDYEYTTRAMGMVHYGVWDNVTFTRPNVPNEPNYPEGFQGNEIPLDGNAVAQLVQKRLTLGVDMDS